MGTELEELRVLKTAETIADAVWQQVIRWDEFAREVVGGQLARAADSIGANIAESFGRFHYGEKIQFLYYARGSLFETKYWLNRARNRELTSATEIQQHLAQLTDVARQLNAFVASIKSQRRDDSAPRTVRESSAVYVTEWTTGPAVLFTAAELAWLAA